MKEQKQNLSINDLKKKLIDLKNKSVLDLVREKVKKSKQSGPNRVGKVIFHVVLNRGKRWQTVEKRVEEISGNDIGDFKKIKKLVEYHEKTHEKSFFFFPNGKGHLIRLVDDLLDFKKEQKIDTDWKCLKQYSKQYEKNKFRSPCKKNKNKNKKLNGFGHASIYFMQMLCGIDAIKPDSRVKNIFKKYSLDKNDKVIIKESKKLANKLNLKLGELDKLLLLMNDYGL